MLPKIILRHKFLFGLLAILIFFLALLAQYIWNIQIQEGLEMGPVPIKYKTDPKTGAVDLNKLLDGYYQYDDTQMAPIPHGFIVDPNNRRRIIPATQVASETIALGPEAPQKNGVVGRQSGVFLTDKYEGYYYISDARLTTLPSDTMPSVSRVSIDYTTIPPTVQVYYNTGFVPTYQYYGAKYSIDKDNKGLALPNGIYFTDSSKNQISFLKYGMIADLSNGFGAIKNPNLISSSGRFEPSTKYADIANNLDTEFHESAEDIVKASDDPTLQFGETRVRDPTTGELIILPAVSKLQGLPTYYVPGSFPYGASSYIPKYEDSVYLSRLTLLPTQASYTSSDAPKGACEEYKHNKPKLEEYCRGLDGKTCASTSCCVLLGGEKCVSGNENGPTFRANYSDFLLRNKDMYYYHGKCFGNCPDA